MTTRVTVHLPDDVYRQAERIAELTNRDVAELLADTIALSLPPRQPLPGAPPPVEQLSDQAVLALAESQMPAAQGRRFSRLLDTQQAGKLSENERAELRILMEAYQSGLLRKAQALREAVRRGMRSPLEA